MPRLAADEVHVWRVDLDPNPPLSELLAVLSADEKARMEGFAFARDRRRFSVSHVASRAVLSRYLGCGPAAIPMRQRSNEKPWLEGAGDVRFNLSHSGDLALIAVTRGREVGVDVEQLRDAEDLAALAADCFAPRELATWRGLPEGERKAAFFSTWTRKEAYLKAEGLGLSRLLQSFEVTVDPGERPRLLRVENDPGEASRWTLRGVPLEPGYAATVCFEGLARVTFWTWNPLDEEYAAGRFGRERYVRGDGEPRGPVLDLAGGEGASGGVAPGRQAGLPYGVLGAHPRGVDGSASGEPAASRKVASPSSAIPTRPLEDAP